MTVFVDASVLVAVIAREDDWREWSLRIYDEDAVTSPLAIWETVRAVQRITKTPYAEVERQLFDTLKVLNVRIVAVGEAEGRAAIGAHTAYGKGEHHAQLNFGDCFAYACAKTNKATLLYKGDDFARTDLA